MKPLPIVHIITKLELGGAQQNTLFTVAHLNRERFQPYLITNDEGILVSEAMALRGVTTFLLPELIREINPLKDIRALLKIRRIVKSLKKRDAAMIVHTHSSKAGILGRWGARLAGADVVIHTIHGFGFQDHQPFPIRTFIMLLERLTAMITDKLIAVSKANIQKGVEKGIFPAQKAILIRSGIELKEFQLVKIDKGDKRKELGVEPTLPLVTMIGCLKPQKAPLDYVEIAHLVLHEKDAYFILVGDGILRDKVEKRMAALGLEKRFKLLGWRRDIPEILAVTDVFCLTSLWEGLPRVLPQAMIMGIPIVATKVDGTPEAVTDGVNGFLLKPHDVEGMAERIAYLLGHSEKAVDMGRRGKTMLEEFDISKMVSEQEKLYLGLLGEKGRVIE